MATFKVGQRVKIANPEAGYECLRGLVGVVDGHPDSPSARHRWTWAVDFGREISYPDGTVSRFCKFNEYELAPLTDPKADAFIESLKNLKPYEEPTVRKVTAWTRPRVFVLKMPKEES